MKIKPITLVFLALIFLQCGNQPNSQKYFVGNTSNLTKLDVTNLEITKFLDDFSQEARIIEALIFEKEDQYFLLGKDDKDGWIYLFKLMVQGKELYLNDKEIINACKSKNLSKDVFLFENGKAFGCNDCNHKIIVKE